ncbi:MAG: TIGR04283 family arsenosugar biosynthesis glycosyltransferase, partial [Gammaproteobacteria bacterium]
MDRTHETSIVVPILNEAERLPRLLDALAPWRAAGDEIVIVDGGSTDGSAALAARGADRVIVAPRGRASQMNAGAARARGRLLWFLHADCLPSPALRAALHAAASTRPWGRFDVRLDDPAAAFRVIEAMMNLRSRLTGIATGDQGIFVTRELFAAVGGYADLALMEDVELSRRLRPRARP